MKIIYKNCGVKKKIQAFFSQLQKLRIFDDLPSYNSYAILLEYTEKNVVPLSSVPTPGWSNEKDL